MFGGPQRVRITLRHAWRSVACALLTVGAGCGGGGSQPPPPDLSGVWAGAWQGNDPSAGGELVSGTWEVEIAQSASSASGAALLLGDIDCMNGQMQTDPGAQTAVTGSLSRPGCALISWLLTAINVAEGKASGSWSNFGTGGSGTLTGDRIARLGGPRIRFVHPPGGKPGAIVTVSGSMLSGLAPADGLTFNFAAQPAPLAADSTRIVARVPGSVSSGPIKVRTGAGTALSPRPFNTDVGSPPVIRGRSGTPGIAPAALAVSPDGRKYYIADRGSSSVRIVRTSTLTDLFSAPIVGVPRSVVASPDGQRIYVASANVGVLVLDAASAFEIDTIPLPINDGGRDNPQGLAISPDGALLVVSEGSSGGSARLYRISDKQLLWSTPPAADTAPLGVAFSPDGTRIYVAVADLTPGAGSLQVFDVDTGALLDGEPVGALPTALAVTPDGNLVFVTNKDSGTVSVYNTNAGSETVVSTVTVGTGPIGIAISPDGARVYVANRGSNSVSVFDALTGAAAAGSPLDLSGVAMEPIAVAMHPAGTLAYVGHVTTNPVVVEIGSMQTLTIARGGSGIGTVRSDVPGIDCGTQCQAQYPFGTSVTLTAVPNSNSTFSHWSGSAGCAGVVTLSTNLNCVANFNSKAPPPSQSSPPPGSCFIATAAYGSDMADDVKALRRFRDDTLLRWAAGREFVRFYYRHSPPLADYIRARDTLRAAVRGALWPLVFAVKHPALAGAAALAMLMLVLGWRQSRRRR